MAVLIEGLSVVIRRSAIDAKFPGGWQSFVTSVPNETFCHDDRLARLGFMGPPEVEAFVLGLEKLGLVYLDGENAVDIAVVDQHSGFVMSCDWLKFGHGNLEGDSRKRVAGCQAVDGTTGKLMLPEGWQFEGSLSEKYPITAVQH